MCTHLSEGTEKRSRLFNNNRSFDTHSKSCEEQLDR